MIENKDKKELKRIANSLKPEFNIGKLGITSKFVETIDNYLTAHNIVKIKALIAENKSSLNKLSEELKNKTNSEIIDKRGFTFVLFRENK